MHSVAEHNKLREPSTLVVCIQLSSLHRRVKPAPLHSADRVPYDTVPETGRNFRLVHIPRVGTRLTMN